jgi:hypothetical protein
MFSRYFREMQKTLIKRYLPAPKKGSVRKTAESWDDLIALIESVLPSDMSAAHVALRDASGYTPDMADFTAFRPVSRDTVRLFGGIIPRDLACGTFHAATQLDRKTLLDSLVRVAHVKKCGHYEGRDGEPSFLASFVIAFGSGYTLAEIREALIETYRSKEVESDFEVDILAVLGRGILVKKWDGSRGYAAIETDEDTLMWLFILMREYLEADKASAVDLRSLVLDQKEYTEY